MNFASSDDYYYENFLREQGFGITAYGIGLTVCGVQHKAYDAWHMEDVIQQMD